MSFLPWVRKKTYLMLFTRMESPELKGLEGFNHMAIGWVHTDEVMQIIEPALQGASIDFVYVKDVLRAQQEQNIEILEVDVRVTLKQRLFKERFQTCATVVQYLAGIDLDATLVQTLYERLTTKDEIYLKRHGIRRVVKWEWKATPQTLS